MNIRALPIVLASLGLVGTLNATPLTGQFNINGSVRIDAINTDWLPIGGPSGQFRTIDPATGSFSGISDAIGTYTGLAKDLANPPAVINTPIFVGGFLSGFTSPIIAPNGLSYGALIFDLTMIKASTAPVCTGLEAVNVSCSGSGSISQFTLKNTGSGTEVDWAYEGYFEFTGDASTRTFGTGLYTAQLNGVAISTFINQISRRGGLLASYSANFAAVPSQVPEPGTVSMLLAGLGLIGVKAFRRRQTQSAA